LPASANPRTLRALSGCVAERDMEASAPPRPRAPVRSAGRLRASGDAELVRLVRLGHEPAFEQIYDRHHRGILSFARHMLGSRDEAEDAVQHTFIAAYRDLRASDKPIHLKAWLYTIARNRCLSMLRARREQVSIDDVEPSTDGLAAQVQQRQDLQDMLRDLHRLPVEQREALVLSELGALSHEEIAVTLGVRKEKVKALVFQARESLSNSRQARNADCHEIQKQLSILRGGSLRRTTLRRHVETCAACQQFKDEVQRQRAAMAVLLPVVPTAGLKTGVLGAVSAGAGAAGTGAVGGGAVLAGAGGGGVGAKLIVGAVLMGGALGGGIMAVDDLRSPPSSSAAEERHEAQARILGFPGAARIDKAGQPADGGAGAVVHTLRARAGAAAQQRAADQQARRLTAFGTTGDKTVPAVVVTIVSDAVGGLGGGGAAPEEPKKAKPDKPGKPGKAKPKKAKKPKVSQGFGAQGKGNAYGRGREPAAGNGNGNPGGAKPAKPATPKANGPSRPGAKPKGGGPSNGAPKAGNNPGNGNGPPAAAAPKKAPKPKPKPKHAAPTVAVPAPNGNGNGNGKGNGGANRNEKAGGDASADRAAEGAVDSVKNAAGGGVPRAGEPPKDDENGEKPTVVGSLIGLL
jgi:RNA polymerase sigma factor (sigma-70 family)